MASKAKFKEKLLHALKHFDLTRAELLCEELYEAEQVGYTLTREEDRLCERLTRCIDSYRRNMAAITG